MSGKSHGCSKSLMLAKAFIWTVAGALRPKRDCLRISCLDLLNSNSAPLSHATSNQSEASRRAAGRFAWMLWPAHSSKHERKYGLGIYALVSVCSWNTTGIMVWAWMLLSAYALGTRTGIWFEHGFSGQRMLLEHERNYGLGMDALVRMMLLEHEQAYWPSQYFVKVVSCRSARYTVRVSESRLPDESKFLHSAETQKC